MPHKGTEPREQHRVASTARLAGFILIAATLSSSGFAQEMRRTTPQPTGPQGQQTSPADPGYVNPSVANGQEWEVAADYVYDSRVRDCRDTQLISDAMQVAAAAMDRSFRQAAPLTSAESEAIGDSIFQTLAMHPDSPMYRMVDPPAREADRRYIETVGRTMLVNLQRDGIVYDFHIVDMDVPNAFAIPGGHIFVTTRLFDDRRMIQNEAQLAAVLAHEIGHVDLRHTSAVYETIRAAGFDPNDPAALQASQLFAQIIRALYQSEFEDESDEYAVRRLFEIGYSPFQFVAQWVAWSQIDGMSSAHGQPQQSQGGTLSDEVRNVLQSHNTPIVRACNTASMIEEIRGQYERQSYYVGFRNLTERVAASQRTY